MFLAMLRQLRSRQSQMSRRRLKLKQANSHMRSNYFSRWAKTRVPARHIRLQKSRLLVPYRRTQQQTQQVVNRFQRKPVRLQPRLQQTGQVMGFLANRRTQWMQKGRGFQGYNVRTRGGRGRGRRMRSGNLQTDSALWRSIGMKLLDKLKPNRDRFDLFNKEYRTQIVRKYILSGLGNIGTNLKQTEREIQFPDRLKPIFAISIRPTRFENLRARLGPWEKHLIHWQGTNGEILDKNKMVRDGTAVARLKRGEIGCYDAHYRLWKHMSEQNIPYALILEDDADINYGQGTVDRINKMFDDLRNMPHDLVYLGHNNNKKPRKQVGCLGVPAGTQGLFMYYLTLEGARKLIPNAIPMTQAVDDYVYVNKSIRQFTLEPRLGYAVNIERSDTANIV